MLKEFSEFVKEILENNSRLYKESVLEKYKNSTDVKYFLDFIYNPYIVTGISDKKLNKSLTPSFWSVGYDTTDEKDLFEYFKVHNTGTDEDIRTIQDFKANSVEEDLWPLVDAIITKNLQLGVDSKTINKIIPGLIPTFDVMLANKYFDKPEVIDGKEFVITTKIDGSRIVAIKNNGEVSFYTRQGQKYEGLVDLEAELKACTYDNFIFDGEIVAIDTDKENTYKNTMKLSRTKDLEKHGLKMLVFDFMPFANWKIQNCPVSYISRRAEVSAMFDLSNFNYFELLPMLYRGSDTSKIIELLNEQTAKGEEGIMINVCDAPYDFKRTNNLLKVKKFQDTELKIIGFEEGTNKLLGTLGAFICEYKNNTVKVGSGLTDEDRAYFWAHKEETIGKYITVKYFETSIDSRTHLESLRFPIYMRIREDI